MAVVSDFTVSSRAADRFNTVTFTDASTGTITERMWLLGDGTVVEGNEITVKHTYTVAGKYTVTLVVRNTTEQDSEVKTDYVAVNEVRPVPSFIIMQTFEASSGAYWRFYIDTLFRVVFETPQYVYRSADAVIDIKKWALVQFDPVHEKMYWGSHLDYYREIVCSKVVNTSPVVPTETKTEIAYQSTIKIDELMVWSTVKNLGDYHKETRGRAGYLDLR